MSDPGLLRLSPGGDFSCEALALDGEDTFTARFTLPADGGFVEVTVLRGAPPGPAFHRFEHCTVRYRGRLDAPTEARRNEVRQLVLGVGASIDARLAERPGATVAQALGRGEAPGRSVFGRETLRALLAPDVVEGRPLLDGWTLADVYPSSHLQQAHSPLLQLVLDFRRGDERAAILVGPQEPGRAGFARSAHLSLSYTAPRGGEAGGAGTLRALVAFLITLRDHPDGEWSFPDVASDVGPALLAAAPAQQALTPPPEFLNLAVDADCGQSCSFCSVKELAPPHDGGELSYGRLCADLMASRQRGVTGLRVNGYDPLAYSRILPLLRHATRLGFERAVVFSPCTLLADRAFCEELLDALPATRSFRVPLYAADAATHDAVVGRPGAHALVRVALTNLRDLSAPVELLSVATTGNLAALPGLLRFAQELGVPASIHLAYPSHESRGDRFFTAAPRQAAVVEALVPLWADGATRPFPVHGVAPCVTFRGLRGLPARRWLDVAGGAHPLPGAEYREGSFRHGSEERASSAFVAPTVPCPHASSCSLLPACGGELLRAYVELHGAGEFGAVGLQELVDGA